MSKHITHLVWLVCLLFASQNSQAQPFLQLPSDSGEKVTKKIVELAKAGVTQKVLVELEAGSIVLRSSAKRVHIQETVDRELLVPGANKLTILAQKESDDRAEVEHLQQELNSLKQQIFPLGRIEDAIVVQDFSHSPLLIVQISNLHSLEKILAIKGVKRVHEIVPVAPAATWPNNYQDLSIINATVAAQAGITGQGTRVAVLDTAAFLAQLPGWNTSTTNACLPYVGNVYTPSQLGKDNCRVFSAYNFTATNINDYCANNYASGVASSCPGHEHGTLDMEIVMRTAPGTWMTALQVFDNNGVGNTAYIVSALNWLIAHHRESPAIVAINISLSVNPAVKQTSSCPNSSLAGLLTTLMAEGVAVVVAAGNSGWKDGVNEPACVPGVISVGATTDSATPSRGPYLPANCTDPPLAADQVGCFSNSQSTLMTLLAPGILIGVASNPELTLQSGTSQAAPHVAGAIAILRGSSAYGNSLNNSDLSALLTATGKPVVDRNATAISIPRLDILAALSPPPLTPGTASARIARSVIPTVVRLLGLDEGP